MTSLKTIIARFTELKDNVAGTSESEFEDLNLNKVDKALKSVGVQLKDSTGQFRNLDEVLLELSSIWQTLDRNTQRYIATTAAGSRQQSRFIALVDNYDRLKELIDIASDSTGKADEQFAKYAETMEYKLNQLATKWEEFRTSFINQEDFKKAIDLVTQLLDKAMNLDPTKAAMIIPFAVLFAKTFVEEIFRQFQASRNNFAQLGAMAASGAIGTGMSKLSPSSQISKAIEKEQTKLIAQQEKISRISRLAETTELSRDNLLLPNGRIIKQDQLKESLQILSSYTGSASKKITASQTKVLRADLSAAGLTQQEIDRGFKALKLDNIRSYREITDSFREGYNKYFIEPVKERLKAANQEMASRDATREQFSDRVSKLSGQKEKAEKEAEKTQNKINNLQKINQYGGAIDTGFVQGTVQGLQQIGSAAGMMASMLIAGAKATDTLNVGLSMLVMTGISQSINAFSALIPAITAAKTAQAAKNAVSKDGKTIEELLAWKTQGYTLTAEEEELVVNADTAAKNANAAATALMTAAVAAAVIVIGALIVLIAKEIIKLNEEKKAKELSTTAIGENTKAIKANNEKLKEVAENLNKYKEATEKARQEVELLTSAEKYNRKAFLTDEELTKRNEIWNQIADKFPELIMGYDAQGNAILNVGQAYEYMTEKANDAYKAALKEEAITSAQASALDFDNKQREFEKLSTAYESYKNSDLLKGIFDLSNEGATGSHNLFETVKETIEESLLKPSELEIMATLMSPTAAINEAWITGIKAVGKGQNIFDKTYDIKTYQGQMNLIEKELGHDSEEYASYLTLLQEFLAKESSGIADIEQLSLPDFEATVKEKLAKNDKTFVDAMGQAISQINEGNIESILNAAQMQQDEVAKAAYERAMTSTIKNLAISSYDGFEDYGENTQKLIVSQLQQSYGLTEEELRKAYNEAKKTNTNLEYSDFYASQLTAIFSNAEVLKKDLIEGLNLTPENADVILADYEALLTEISELPLKEQASYIQDNKFGGKGNPIYQNWLKIHSVDIQAARENSEKLQKILYGEQAGPVQIDEYGELIPNGDKIKEFYLSLGEEARIKFLEGLQGVSDANKTNSEIAVKNYADGIIEAAKKYGLNDESLLDYIMGYNVSDNVSETTYLSNKQAFVNQVLGIAAQKNIDVAKSKIEDFFDTYVNLAKEAGTYKPTENLAIQTELTVAALKDVNSVLESNSDLLKGFAQEGQGIITIDPKEVKKLQDMFTALSELESGAIDPAILNATLKITDQGALLDTTELSRIISEYTQQRGDELLKNVNLSKEEKDELLQQVNYAKVLLGIYQTIGDTLDNTSNAISAFSSAAKEQLDQGYLNSSTIKSLGDAFNALGLQADFDKNHGFINEKLQLDREALHDYLYTQMQEIETSGRLNNMNEEQRLIWQALKKELYITNLELQNEAKNTDEVADAWEDYNKQLDTVKEKQEALNDKIEAYNKLLYGDDLRKSGLDLLYNYNEAISTFNDEMSRAQDILSDAKNMKDATAAFEQYAAATHNLIVEEKAKQEQLQRGLNEYARMIEHGYASYTDTQTGRTIGINFGDYAKFDQNTGKYIINQTLLNRAKFNDDYKDLIEEYVETYNKYADEYKKSQDEVLKTEKEFQKLRKEALKNYADFEKSIADELKNQYEEEVDNLKEKYDAMKEEDDDYIKALQEAIDKQRKLRDRESKFEDLAKKEKKLSLISRDTSGANRLQELQLEEEVQKSRQDLLDEQVDNIIDGMQKLYESQEETRNVEIELKEAIIDNTALINSQAEEFGRGFTDADSYIEFMTQSKEFTELTYVQQLEKIEEYRETYAAAAQYMAMQNMDATAKSGDFVKDIIETTGEEIAWVVSNTSSTFVDEASRAYQAVSREVSESLDNAIKDIQNARDALKEAIEKLDEYARKAQLLQEKLNYMAEQGLNGDNPGADHIPPPVSLPGDAQAAEDAIQQYHNEKLQPIREILNMNGATREEMVRYVESNYNSNEAIGQKLRQILTDIMGYDVKKIANLSWQGRLSLFKDEISRYANGGLVDFTGPAWVDGTKSAPEAFLNPEDTRRIGEAARILSNLPFFNSYGEANETITNNNGNISIEINLNVDKLSSEIDVDEMLNRVKEEIVSVARPAGINTILTQQ